MRTNDRLTADDVATWRVTLLDSDGKPDKAGAQEFRAVYYRADAIAPELTSWKNEHHKPVRAFVTDKIADIERITAPLRESSRQNASP